MTYYISAKNIENNRVITSSTPLIPFIQNKHIYGLYNENDFTLEDLK